MKNLTCILFEREEKKKFPCFRFSRDLNIADVGLFYISNNSTDAMWQIFHPVASDCE